MTIKKSSPLPVIGSKPVDRTALAVILPGESWAPKIPYKLRHTLFNVPLKCKPVPEDQQGYLGMVRGNLMAIGFLYCNQKQESFWLMRCTCGRYARRRILKWVKNLEAFDQCVACETQTALTHKNPSHQTHGIRRARWMGEMRAAGLTDEQITIVEQYGLPLDDMDWLRNALASLQVGAEVKTCAISQTQP